MISGLSIWNFNLVHTINFQNDFSFECQSMDINSRVLWVCKLEAYLPRP
jgi:hypothetical protein